MVSSLDKFRGVLKAREGAAKFSLTHHWPSADLSFFVERYWIVRWDLRGKAPHVQETLPNPCVNLVFEKGRSGVFGVMTGKFSRLLENDGCAVGVKFKPGGFFPFAGTPISGLTNRSKRLEDAFAADSRSLEATIFTDVDETRMVGAVEGFLRARLPEKDENVIWVNLIVDRIFADERMTRVCDLARAFDTSERTLQRLFRRYVGVGPKWVITRYRLQEAVHRLESGGRCNWADLALQLGYFDQSHFARDFKEIMGATPAEYAREIHDRPGP